MFHPSSFDDMYCHFFYSYSDVEHHHTTGQLGSDATSSSAESTQTHLTDGHVRGPIRPVHLRATSPNFSQWVKRERKRQKLWESPLCPYLRLHLFSVIPFFG